MRVLKITLLALALTLLGACSAIKLGYNQLPSLSYWWLDSKLSFSDSQSGRAKEALEGLHRWHRQQELPVYGQWIDRAAQTSTKSIQAQEVCDFWSEGQARADRLVQEALRLSAPTLAELGPKQLAHLARELQKSNEEWDKKWLRTSREERNKQRLDTTIERYSDFYGPLSASQSGLLQSQLAQSLWTPEWGAQQRLRQQQDLRQTLQKIQQQKLSPSQAQAELWEVWQRWFVPVEASDAALVQQLRAKACQNLADFHNSTSAEQRQRVSRRLRAYERDVADLIRP